MTSQALVAPRTLELDAPGAAHKQGSVHVLVRVLRSRSALVGGTVLLLVVLLALAAPVISPYDPIKTNQRLSLEQPSFEHLMGT
ncbi:MAG TPA: hypothetical protein VFB50_11290, partial [Chloroflexota bacterium]|nr:hypothetical protein [Chloroflexota bacterium]